METLRIQQTNFNFIKQNRKPPGSVEAHDPLQVNQLLMKLIISFIKCVYLFGLEPSSSVPLKPCFSTTKLHKETCFLIKAAY